MHSEYGLVKGTMRSDYLFYALAAVFFLITAASIALVIDQTEKSLWVVSTVVVGLFSATLGYHFRPKTPVVATQKVAAPADQPAPAQAEKTETGPITIATPVSLMPVAKQELATAAPAIPVAIEAPAAPTQSELVTLKGINAKRAAQLNAVGISNLEDLAKASADDLAKALAVSPKITRMWIGSAKKQKK